MGCGCGKKSVSKKRSNTSPAPLSRSTNTNIGNTVVNSNTRSSVSSNPSSGMDRSRLESERIRREILQRKLGK